MKEDPKRLPIQSKDITSSQHHGAYTGRREESTRAFNVTFFALQQEMQRHILFNLLRDILKCLGLAKLLANNDFDFYKFYICSKRNSKQL